MTNAANSIGKLISAKHFECLPMLIRTSVTSERLTPRSDWAASDPWLILFAIMIYPDLDSDCRKHKTSGLNRSSVSLLDKMHNPWDHIPDSGQYFSVGKTLSLANNHSFSIVTSVKTYFGSLVLCRLFVFCALSPSIKTSFDRITMPLTVPHSHRIIAGDHGWAVTWGVPESVKVAREGTNNMRVPSRVNNNKNFYVSPLLF